LAGKPVSRIIETIFLIQIPVAQQMKNKAVFGVILD
jgi:hypothetical protein